MARHIYLDPPNDGFHVTTCWSTIFELIENITNIVLPCLLVQMSSYLDPPDDQFPVSYNGLLVPPPHPHPHQYTMYMYLYPPDDQFPVSMGYWYSMTPTCRCILGT